MDNEQLSSGENDGAVLSFTFDDSDEVKALVKDDDTGNLYLREKDKWSKVGKDAEAPELYDLDIVDIKPAEYDRATRIFDQAGEHNELLQRDDVADLL